MQGPWKPDMRLHSKVIDFHAKVNVDNYILAGWELIEIRTEGEGAAIFLYRLGWRKDEGEPIEPPVIDESPAPQEWGPSTN
jgi:hypothetical protein